MPMPHLFSKLSNSYDPVEVKKQRISTGMGNNLYTVSQQKLVELRKKTLKSCQESRADLVKKTRDLSSAFGPNVF